MHRLIPVFLLALTSCASFEVYKPDAEGHPEKVAEAFVFGQGCAVAQQTSLGWEVLLQHSGMSQTLGGTIRSIVSVAGSVFGGVSQDQDELVARGGCVGALSDAEEFPDEELPDEEPE